MATQTRIYIVEPKASTEPATSRLVRASHPSHALRHVAEDQLHVAVASQDDLMKCFEQGIKVENVKHEQQELPAT